MVQSAIIKYNLTACIWLSLLCGLYTSCNGNTTNDEASAYDFPQIDTLVDYETILIEQPFIQPRAITVTDSLLTVYDSYNNHLINIFSLKTGKLINKYVSIGRGPGEVVHPSSIEYDHSSKTATIYNDNNNLLLKFPIQADSNKRVESTSVNIPIMYGFKVQHIRDSLFLTLSSEPQHMYQLISGKKVVNKFFFFPGDTTQFTPSKAYAYQGYFVSNHNKTKFLYAGFMSDLTEIYNFNGETMSKISSRSSYVPTYEDVSTNDSRSVVFSRDNRSGFTAVALGDTRIYLLHSGRSRISHPDTYYSANEVYVLDWDGHLIRKLILNINVKSICINEDESKLYAITDTEGTADFIYFNM